MKVKNTKKKKNYNSVYLSLKLFRLTLTIFDRKHINYRILYETETRKFENLTNKRTSILNDRNIFKSSL